MSPVRPIAAITVPIAALAELILEVHAAIDDPDNASARRWRYRNVVGIGKAHVRDLDPATYGDRASDEHSVAALTATSGRNMRVDVVFEIDDARASAQFFCATKLPGRHSGQTASWAEALARTTSAALAGRAVAAQLHRRCSDDAE